MNITYMALAYDAVAVILVLTAVIRRTKYGFSDSFIRIAGGMAAIVLSIIVCRIGTEFILTSVVRPLLTNQTADAAASVTQSEVFLGNIEGSLSGLPAFVFLIFKISGAADGTMLEAVTESGETLSDALMQYLLEPVLRPVLRVLLFIVSMLVLLLLLHVIEKRVRGVRKNAVFGGTDGFLGFVLGLIEGALRVCAFAFAISVAKLFLEGRWEFLSDGVIAKTYLFKWVYGVVGGAPILP
ncbi:MAG TPA: hypothetical protein PLU75_04045 [Oscillospiraceae bacterium]|jgi:hypothetical protein|nr:hypothetical protein [Oscillospiraceae bacterium]HRW56737.1 hypothetical protein [Oscillospiraceae bacterium]